MSVITITDIVEAIHGDLDKCPDAPLENITLGTHLASVGAGSMGIASRVDAPHGKGDYRSISDFPESLSAQALARMLHKRKEIPELGVSTPMQVCTMAMAAANALLPDPALRNHAGGDGELPEGYCAEKGQDLVLRLGKGRNVAVVGHFPFVERLADNFANFWVLEKRPRPGDLDAAEASRVMPRADVAAITSTSISNGTLGELLSLCREDTFVLMLGPSTPFAPSLFELGVDALAGAVVHDPDTARLGIMNGLPYKGLSGVFGAILNKNHA